MAEDTGSEEYFSMKFTEHDKKRLRALADAYGVTMSGMVRRMMGYFEENMPTVTTTVTISPKASAQVPSVVATAL